LQILLEQDGLDIQMVQIRVTPGNSLIYTAAVDLAQSAKVRNILRCTLAGREALFESTKLSKPSPD